MSKKRVAIVTPVYNDWGSFEQLVQAIDTALETHNVDMTIIAIDDSSTQPISQALFSEKDFQCVRLIEIVHLARNTGHQRAIAIGLSYLEQKHQVDSVIIMDSDGEDRPADLPVLLEMQTATNQIVFAKRGQRREGGFFRLFNWIYHWLFYVLTARQIPFGNFCILPGAILRQVVFLPEIWNHLAAGILRSGLPHAFITIDRGTRYHGKSKMNFVGLVMHGLSAFSVYTDILSVRLMLFTLIVAGATIAGALALLYVRYLTPLAIPGWATTVGFGLVVVLLQTFLLMLSIAFNVLNSRATQTYIPTKHYQDFILNAEVCYERG